MSKKLIHVAALLTLAALTGCEKQISEARINPGNAGSEKMKMPTPSLSDKQAHTLAVATAIPPSR